MIPQLLALALLAPPEVATATATRTPPLSLPASPAGVGTIALPALLLLALASAALVLTRKRRLLPRRIQILETASLGPRRALVLARLGGEVLLLGSSEAGVALLRTLPAEPAAATDLAHAPARAPAHAPPASGAEPAERSAPPAPLAALAARLGLARGRSQPAGRGAGFEALLAESAEDQELRRKLALGRPGSVR